MRRQGTKVITILKQQAQRLQKAAPTAPRPGPHFVSKNQNLRSRHHVPLSLSTSMINNLTLQWVERPRSFDCRDAVSPLLLTPFSPLSETATWPPSPAASPRHENQPLRSSLPILPDPASLPSLHSLTFRSRACPRPPARRCLGSRRRSAFV